LLNGVGGKIEPNERPEDAMAREFFEETGVQTQPCDWFSYCVLTEPSSYSVCFFYCFSSKIGSVQSIEKEIVSIHNIAQLPDNIIFNLKWLIPLALDSKLIKTPPIQLAEKHIN
jgi:8-oxo-dGTP diphosphatase